MDTFDFYVKTSLLKGSVMQINSKKTIDSTDTTIFIIADKIVKEVADLMRTSKSEEDLRIGFEKVLSIYLNKLDIHSAPKYEKSIFEIGKRTDSIHGQIIIEYEKPKIFKSKSAIEHAHNQLVEYIIGEASVKNELLFLYDPKYIGVGFDGKQIFFVRYKGDKDKPKTKFEYNDFIRIGPYPFDNESCRTLITYFRALSKRLLTPENILESFGPSSKIAPMVVSAMTDALKNWSDTKIEVFFNEWKRLFGIVYGEQFSSKSEDELNALKKLYNITRDIDFQELLFCIHTYFGILMKLIAAELIELKESTLTSSFCQRISHLPLNEFELQLHNIENGGIYAKRGITNFLEGDFFQWYLNAFSSPRLQEALLGITRTLSDFEPATSLITPEITRDLLKKISQNLVPKEVRHQLGEYYTPDWLAELVLNEIGYDGNTLKSILDPACGSGTFLVLAIQRAKAYSKKHGIDRYETTKRIVNKIWGFDLNPLAVIAARTNYLFALGELVEELKQFEIPIYLADSVLWPEKKSGQLELAPAHGEYLTRKTSVGTFHVPQIWLKNNGLLMKTATPIIEYLIKDQIESDIALIHLTKAGCVFPPHENTVEYFYNELLDLERMGKNGIWARFLKNAFATMMAGKFDYVVGNPPWVRWGYLSSDYRNATLELWKNYGLFSLKGYAARLGGGEKDFSMLFLYAVTDYFLKVNGELGFLITQEVFKSKGAGKGFRRFKLGSEEDPTTYFKVIKAHDLVSIQPFEGATNKTAAIFIRKGEKTQYPVPYYVWSKKGKGRISPDLDFETAMGKLTKIELQANPIDGDTGSWQTLSPDSKVLAGISNNNYYHAKLGARVEPYGIFWIRVKEILADNTLIINNLFDRGKKKFGLVEMRIESDLVFPAITGADIRRWIAVSNVLVIICQDPEKKAGYDERLMKTSYPRTYSYLLHFKKPLLERAAYKKYYEESKDPFYSQFNIADYTFSQYKVVWKRMSNDIVASVISSEKTQFGHKTVIPTDTVSFFSTNDKEEAHFLCAIINSNHIRNHIKSYSSAGRGFGTPSVMENVGIPQFNNQNKNHLKLSELSQSLHELVKRNQDTIVNKIENDIEDIVAKIFLNSLP